MIYLDNRIGSKELFTLMPKGLVELTRLEYGDASFLGRGADDVPMPIGVERKRLGDFLVSMTTGRLSGHQIPGLLASYDVVYLVLEGLWRPNPNNGLLEKPTARGWAPVSLGPRQFMAKEVWSYMNTLQIMVNMHVWHSGTARSTAQWLTNLYHWWNNKPLDAHKGHLKPHKGCVQLSTKRPGIVQRVAAELGGVGFERSKAVAKKFGSLMELVLAAEEDWRSVEGIGKTLAKRIMKEIHNEDI